MKSLIKVSVALSLSIILFLGNPFSTSASTQSGSIDLRNLEGNPDVEIEELTYEEMINELSESKKISIDEAKEKYPNLNVSNQDVYNHNEYRKIANSSCGQYSPHKFRVTLNVTSTYKPTLDLYTWVCNSGSVVWAEKLADVDMNRKSGFVTKQYTGTISAEITTNVSIWWKVNGDFYDNGTTTISGSLKGGGAGWEGSGTITHQSSHYKYYNNNGTFYLF